MQVVTISVTRARKVQPEQYGSADASITVAANLEEGEAWQDAARTLLNDTRAIVYENLGLKLPTRATEAVKTTEAASSETVSPAAKGAATTKPAETAAPKGEDTKRKPGRPSTKKGIAPEAAVDVPADPEPNIRANPEDRVNPDDDVPDVGAGTESKPAAAANTAADDVPDDATPMTGGTADVDPIGEYTTADLQNLLTNLVKNKKVTAQRVREIVASYGVARTSDLPADKVLEVKTKIEAEAAK